MENKDKTKIYKKPELTRIGNLKDITRDAGQIGGDYQGQFKKPSY